MKRTILTLATIAALGTGWIALGAGKAPDTGREPALRKEPWCGERILKDLAGDPAVQKRLHLTDDQIAEMISIRDRARANLEPLEKKQCRASAEAYKGISDAGASRGEIADLFEAEREAQAAIGREIMERLLDAREVLYSDQREELRVLHREKNGCDKAAASTDRTAELRDDKDRAADGDPPGN